MTNQMNPDSSLTMVNCVDDTVVAHAQLISTTEMFLERFMFDRFSVFSEPPQFFQNELG